MSTPIGKALDASRKECAEWKGKAERFALELELSQKRVATLETAIQNLTRPARQRAPLLALPAPWQEGT